MTLLPESIPGFLSHKERRSTPRKPSVDRASELLGDKGSIHLHTLASLPEPDRLRVADLYCEIYGQPPWNEQFDRATVLGRMASEESVSTSSYVLTLRDSVGEIQGFTWGSSAPAEAAAKWLCRTQLTDQGEHPSWPDISLHLIDRMLRGEMIDHTTDSVAIVSEIAVKKGFRHLNGQSVSALMLYCAAANRFEAGDSTYVLSTIESSRSVPLARKLGASDLLHVSDLGLTQEYDPHMFMRGDVGRTKFTLELTLGIAEARAAYRQNYDKVFRRTHSS